MRAAGDLDLAGAVTGPATALTAGGAISQSGGIITAGTLTGSAGTSASLFNGSTGNQVGTLQNFTAGTNLSFTNAVALIATNDAATAGALGLTTQAGSLSVSGVSGGTSATLTAAADLDLVGAVAGPATTLTSGAAINQTAGVITANTLTGSSVGAASLFNGATGNQVGTLQNFTAGTNLSFTNAVALIATNDAATAGALGLTTQAGSLSVSGISGGTSATLSAAGDLDLT